MKRMRLLIPLLALGLAALACNLPGQAEPTPQIPPLDQTVTALFKTAAAMPATNTPPPAVATSTREAFATLAPSATQAPPTHPPPTQ
nr:hypothetical protein [Anaerolinea sp.]